MNEPQHRWTWGVLSALFLLSCAHAESAKPAPASTPPHSAAPAASSKQAPQHEEIGAFMADHFMVVTWARDCVISGNLEALREPLRELGDYQYKTVALGAWMPFVADLQEAALLTADAETLDLAASGVATMARVCGDCHQAKAAGPKFPHAKRDRERGSAESLEERMQRHIWAADRMWEGLTAPSDTAWIAGAKALADAPAGAPTTPKDLPPQVVAALDEVRQVGTRALDAATLRDRADVFGMFLSTCANCHSQQVELKF